LTVKESVTLKSCVVIAGKEQPIGSLSSADRAMLRECIRVAAIAAVCAFAAW
jgi:hypothetical protein